MAEEPTSEETAEGEVPKGVGGYLYRLALAGVGAVMLAQEELEARFKRRVETPSHEGEPLPPGAQGSVATPFDSDAAPIEGGADEAPGEPAADGSEPPRAAFFSQIDATVANFLHKLVPGRA